MNKDQYLKSITTKQLISWHERAEANGGTYSAFDQENNRSMLFTFEAINVELMRREDLPENLKPKKAKLKK